MNKSVIASILLCCFALAGCRDENLVVDPPVTPPTLQLTLEEEQVVANCYIVQQAVEAFAADNNGVYPWDVGVDTSMSGNTVFDLLPGGQLIVNPYSGDRTEPSDGTAGDPGQVGYTDTGGSPGPIDYVIWGSSENGLIIQLTKDQVIYP